MFCEVRATKPAQAKTRKYPGPMGPFLSSCWTLIFFWCLPMFGASSGLVLFFLIGACQCFVKSESQNLHRHQQNNKTKPVDAPNLHRPPKKQKKLESMTYGSTSE